MVALDECVAKPHMQVITADGANIGVVDSVADDKLKLSNIDSPDRPHDLVPLHWVDHVDTAVHLNRTLSDIGPSAKSAGISDRDDPAAHGTGSRSNGPKT